MPEDWFVARKNLRLLRQQHPDWSIAKLARALDKSRTWVKKWLRRLAAAAPDNEMVLLGLPHNRKTPPSSLDPLIVSRILDIRDHPPHNLARVPGPRFIVAALKEDKILLAQNLKPPTSTATIWRVLVANGRIQHSSRPHHQPLPRPAPMQSWQLDFKDASSVVIEPDGKQQHVVEVLNIIDVGTSILVESVARSDYNAQTVLTTVADILQKTGLPQEITFDNDPRFVGSHSGRDFPAAFVRFWQCLDVEVNFLPAHRPDLNGFVERFHRSQGSECLDRKKPSGLGEVREVIAEYKEHYNWERPHQGLSCQNKPPRVAFPELPPLRPLPMWVNPDRWLSKVDGWRFRRRVRADGWIEIDKRGYYVGKQYKGCTVVLEVKAQARQFEVYGRQQEIIKKLDIKGLQNGAELSMEEYVRLIEGEALSEARRSWAKSHAGPK